MEETKVYRLILVIVTVSLLISFLHYFGVDYQFGYNLSGAKTLRPGGDRPGLPGLGRPGVIPKGSAGYVAMVIPENLLLGGYTYIEVQGYGFEPSNTNTVTFTNMTSNVSYSKSNLAASFPSGSGTGSTVLGSMKISTTDPAFSSMAGGNYDTTVTISGGKVLKGDPNSCTAGVYNELCGSQFQVNTAAPFVNSVQQLYLSGQYKTVISGSGFSATGNTVTFTNIYDGSKKYTFPNLNREVQGQEYVLTLPDPVPNLPPGEYEVSVTTSAQTVLNGVESGSCSVNNYQYTCKPFTYDPAYLDSCKAYGSCANCLMQGACSKLSTAYKVTQGSPPLTPGTYIYNISPEIINTYEMQQKGSIIRVDGQGFSSTGNKVTFTSLTSPGAKYSVSNLNSYNSVSIDVNVQNIPEGNYHVSVTNSSNIVIKGVTDSYCSQTSCKLTYCTDDSAGSSEYCTAEFTLNPSAYIYSITPTSGAKPNDTIRLEGYGFSSTGNTVTFTSPASPGTTYSVPNLNAIIFTNPFPPPYVAPQGSIDVKVPNIQPGTYYVSATNSSKTVMKGLCGVGNSYGNNCNYLYTVNP